LRTLIKPIFSALISILIIVASLDSAILIHEWEHGLMAWINNVKSNPLDIYYGDWTLLNVDENVDYESLFKAGRNWAVAFIAITPITVNAIITIICFILMNLRKIQMHKWVYAFIFWFCAFNLSEFFSYIPIRTFVTHADVANFNRALKFSPWLVCIPGTLFSIIGIFYFYRKILPMAYCFLKSNHILKRSTYLAETIFIFFFMGGYRGAYHYGSISALMGTISLCCIPIAFILCFPSRKWVTAEIEKAAQQ